MILHTLPTGANSSYYCNMQEKLHMYHTVQLVVMMRINGAIMVSVKYHVVLMRSFQFKLSSKVVFQSVNSSFN